MAHRRTTASKPKSPRNGRTSSAGAKTRQTRKSTPGTASAKAKPKRPRADTAGAASSKGRQAKKSTPRGAPEKKSLLNDKPPPEELEKGIANTGKVDFVKNIIENSKAIRSFSITFAVFFAVLLCIFAFIKDLLIGNIIIERIKHPEMLAKIGYSEEVVANRLVDAMREIQENSGSGGERRGFVPVSGQQAYLIPESNISFSLVARYLREIIGIPKIRIAGEFFCDKVDCGKRDVHLRLRIHASGKVKAVSLDSLGDNSAHSYFLKAAEKVLREIDPYVAAAYLRVTKPQEALQIALRISHQEHRQAKWVHNLLGNLYADRKEFDQAVRWYQSAIDIDPTMIYPHYNLGMALLADNRPADAVSAFARGVTRSPTSLAKPHRGWGDLLFDQAFGRNNNEVEFADYYIAWGDAHSALNEYDAAIGKYKKAALIEPGLRSCCSRWAMQIRKFRKAEVMDEMHEELPRESVLVDPTSSSNSEDNSDVLALSPSIEKHPLARRFTELCIAPMRLAGLHDASAGSRNSAKTNQDLIDRNLGQDEDDKDGEANEPAQAASEKQSPALPAADDRENSLDNAPKMLPDPKTPPAPAG